MTLGGPTGGEERGGGGRWVIAAEVLERIVFEVPGDQLSEPRVCVLSFV